MENSLGRAKPESNQFSIKTWLEIEGKWYGAGQARISWVFNETRIRNSMKMAWGEPGQNLINFQLKSN